MPRGGANLSPRRLTLQFMRWPLDVENIAMPEYLFVIWSADCGRIEQRSAALQNDAAALHYACHIIKELRAGGGYDDPTLIVDVMYETREMALSVPFFAACA